MKNWIKAFVLLTCALFFAACVGAPSEQTSGNKTQTNTGSDPNKKIKIGFAMDTVKEERWQRDKDAFQAHCKELNVECVNTGADNRNNRNFRSFCNF